VFLSDNDVLRGMMGVENGGAGDLDNFVLVLGVIIVALKVWRDFRFGNKARTLCVMVAHLDCFEFWWVFVEFLGDKQW